MTNTLSMPTSDPLLVNSLTGISLSRCLELRLAWLSVRNLFCLLEIHATLIQRSGVVLVAVLFFYLFIVFLTFGFYRFGQNQSSYQISAVKGITTVA